MEPNRNYDYLLKLCLLGDSGVGKTSMFFRWTDNTFTENYFCTIGIDFKIKIVNVRDKIAKIQLWDTAGQERFRTISGAYFRGAAGIVIVYDITNQESFDNVSSWIDQIYSHATPQLYQHKILVGNKTDLEDKRVISFKQGLELAESYGMKFIEVSAKNGSNIEEAFYMLCCEIIPETIEKTNEEKLNEELEEKSKLVNDNKSNSVSNMVKDVYNFFMDP